ncbi:endonuclease/exonuclease/phosphatase family protein [Kitasatospora sp. NPDC093558]|uniref:endonuclease/exonuclease/phosphatase family protein n=1 Tax=Kitasatospora sp. NPDC093558 TaxID=3155201 RepID=UPI00341A2E7D
MTITLMSFNIEQLPSIVHESAMAKEALGRIPFDLTGITSLIRQRLGSIALPEPPEVRQRRARRTGRYICDHAPDVVVLSEAFNEQAWQMFGDMKNPEQYPYQTDVVGFHCGSGGNWTSMEGSCSNDLDKVNGGVVILSKFPIEESHQLVFHSVHGDTADTHANKGAVLAKMATRDGIVWLVGTHLQADQTPDATTQATQDVRFDQLREITAWVSRKVGEVSGETAPVIIAGDLNFEKYRTIPTDGHAPSGMENEGALREAERILGDGQLCSDGVKSPRRYSYDAVENSRARANAGKGFEKYQNILDYVGWIGMPSADRNVSIDLAYLSTGDGAESLSDHQPVLAEVNLYTKGGNPRTGDILADMIRQFERARDEQQRRRNS